MIRIAIVLTTCLFAANASAQQPPSQPQTSPPPSSNTPDQPAHPVIHMEEPQVGDHWAYEMRDEISGKVTGTRDNLVTEVAPETISVRFTIVGTTRGGFNLYDRSWNLKQSGPTSYSPNEGASGVPANLSVGKTWTFESSQVNSSNGNSWKRSGSSKVIGQETFSTKAGTFDTFKIETSVSVRNANNPTGKEELTLLTWYAPAIDHWVKRTITAKVNGHLRDSSTLELVDYGRKG
jgi:hypothetical protein